MDETPLSAHRRRTFVLFYLFKKKNLLLNLLESCLN